MARAVYILILIFLCLGQGDKSFAQTSNVPTESRALSATEALKIVREALKDQRERSRKMKAEYQYQTDDKPCPHCPEYLSLIREVNKIVEKMPAGQNDSVALQNESMIQLSRLKFMYYEVKMIDENGGEKCVQYQHADPINPKLFTEDNTVLIAEEALHLPNVSSFMFYPQGNQREIRYFYRGEGTEKDVMVEVVIFPDRTAALRYHRLRGYDKEYNLPALTFKQEEDKDPIDKIAAPSAEVKVGEGVDVKMNGDIKIEKQSGALALRDRASGKDWVKMDVQVKSLKDLEVSTVVPVEWKLTDGSLKIGGEVALQNKKDLHEHASEETKSFVLALTDHNHEYFKASVVQKDDLDTITLSSKYSLGDYGSLSTEAKTDSNGSREFSFAHGFSDSRSSTKTIIGMSSDAKRFLEFQREQKIGKTQSMVLSIRTDDDHQTSIMYQYKITLK